ncbi:MAG: 50S ribosomal protein L10 [Candidatus Aenigmarchaeota archaeon]|nr:50S ribosomal protein L10 [Candidatus Aenigmarchaeota archaeon]
MVNQQKSQTVDELKRLVDSYSVVGVLNMHKMPSKQLFDIRNALHGEAKIRMAKSSLIKRAFEASNKKGLKDLEKNITGEVALIFTNSNPFKLYNFLEKNKQPAAAKPGDITPVEIVIPAGPTQFAAGPVISEFQKAKVKTTVENGKITVKEDTVVAKAGTQLTKELTEFIMKFGIEPMKIGLDLVSMLDNGTVFGKDVLGVPTEEYLNNMVTSYYKALNLSVNVGYTNKDSVKVMIANAFRNAKYVAIEHSVYEKEIIGNIMAKYRNVAENMKQKLNV